MINLNITSGIYCLINKVNLRVYVGQSSNIESRVYGHVGALRAGEHPNLGLQADWFAFGADAFEAQVLVTADNKVKRLKLETIFMHVYQALDPLYGYNLSTGWNRPTKYNTRKTRQLGTIQ